MYAIKDISGTKFGRLTVIGRAKNETSRDVKWTCLCECGSIRTYLGKNLKNGRSKSCGCHGRKKIAEYGLSHGRPEYGIWSGMISRCNNVNDKRYNVYGGRGIAVCERWMQSFIAFLDDMGERPSKNHSIDRIDNDGNYEPGNCRWATILEQANNRSNNKKVLVYGESLTIAQCSRKHEVNRVSLTRWLKAGLSIEERITRLKTAKSTMGTSFRLAMMGPRKPKN